MNLQEENEALREACTKALESAKRNRLNLKEVLAENEDLKQQIVALQREVQMHRIAFNNKQRSADALESIAADTDIISAQAYREWMGWGK